MANTSYHVLSVVTPQWIQSSMDCSANQDGRQVVCTTSGCLRVVSNGCAKLLHLDLPSLPSSVVLSAATSPFDCTMQLRENARFGSAVVAASISSRILASRDVDVRFAQASTRHRSSEYEAFSRIWLSISRWCLLKALILCSTLDWFRLGYRVQV